jgi:hypothetical protein
MGTTVETPVFIDVPANTTVDTKGSTRWRCVVSIAPLLHFTPRKGPLVQIG